MLNEDLYFVELENMRFTTLYPLCPVSAFPIHPEGVDSPWTVDFPPDCGYKVKVERGVYQVFRSQEDMDSNKPINYEVDPVHYGKNDVFDDKFNHLSQA